MRTLVLFANPSTTVGELVTEKDPQRRSFMRNSFGYSLVTLRDALPAPIVGATRLLREWQRRSARLHRPSQGARDDAMDWEGKRICSSAFWVSVVAHIITDAPDEVCRVIANMSEALPSANTSCARGNNKDAMCVTENGPCANVHACRDDPHPCVIDDDAAAIAVQRQTLTMLYRLFSSHADMADIQQDDKARVEKLLGFVLASAAARAVRCCPDSEWSERYCTNFFLPIENFVCSLDVSYLSTSRKHVKLEDFATRD